MSSHIYSSSAAPQVSPQDQPDPAGESSSRPNSKVSITSHNQYHSPRLLRSSLDPDPLKQFKQWFQDALTPPPDSGIPAVREPEAMAISSVSSDGVPSTRMVLLKTVDDKGFLFFTNYDSRKSRELAQGGYASIAIYWKEVSRQVRVVGRVEKVDRKDSEEYFGTRPRGSQIGAWASPQSRAVRDGELEERVKHVEKRFEGGQVECPEHWGGWRIVPL